MILHQENNSTENNMTVGLVIWKNVLKSKISLYLSMISISFILYNQMDILCLRFLKRNFNFFVRKYCLTPSNEAIGRSDDFSMR